MPHLQVTNSSIAKIDTDFSYNPPSTPLNIIYQDNDLIVVDKPSGLLSVPGRGELHKDCLLSRIEEQGLLAMACHRLDLDTSGLMVYALNKDSLKSLNNQFANRTITKEYCALVKGQVHGKNFISMPLRCDWDNRPLQMVDTKLGKQSLTEVNTIDNFKHFSLVNLIPHTGRSHQLRVHLQSINHAIVGDRFYGADVSNLSTSLCLSSVRLGFIHPSANEYLEFRLPEYEKSYRAIAQNLATYLDAF